MSPSLVVLTDFFAISNRTLSYTAGLAVPLHAHLVLLHVRHDGRLAPAGYQSYRSGQLTTTRALQKLAADQPVPTEVAVADDFLPEGIADLVAQHQPLLLVLGRPGSATAPLEIVVSTAFDLLRHAPYPLLVVPTLGWGTFPPRRLLLAVDGEPFELGAHADVLRRLRRATGGTLDVVHVTADAHARPETSAVLRAIRRHHLTADVPPQHLHEVYDPSVPEGVLQEAARLDADMLVVVARRPRLPGSLLPHRITARLVQESPIPVLLLPAEGPAH